LSAFRYGANTLTIRVEKAAQPRGQRCYDAKVPRYVSVIANVFLSFGADLVARPSDSGTTQVSKNVGPGSKATITGALRFRNNGPSSGLGGHIEVGFNGDSGVTAILVKDATVVHPPFKDCQWTLASATLGSSSVTCSYDELKPGAESSISLVAGYLVGSSFPPTAVRRLRLTWTILSDTHADNPGGGNETATYTFVLCGSAATDPACA
jgi:hypothetical protein